MDKVSATRATLFIMALFFLQPLIIGGWLAVIPLIKENIGLTKGELAIALMGAPIALIPSLQVAGRIISKFGPRRVFVVFFPVQCLAALLLLAAWSGPSLFAALFLVGIGIAFIEVGINVYAGRLEKQAGLIIMNRCHGFWALGVTAGSALLTLLMGVPWLGMALLAAATIGLAIPIARMMPQLGGDETKQTPPRRKWAQLPAALIFVAIFMFLVTLAEGTMADWLAVYLSERLGDPEARAGVAVTVFSAFLAGGRFVGDWLKIRLGAVRQARLMVGCAMAGLFLLVLPLPLWLAFPGFAMIGFGVASAYPLGVSAIAALDDTYEASNIAIMATVAMGGFLIGPPLIGTLSEAFSLPVAFAVLIPGLWLAMALTGWLRPESGR